MWIHYLQWHIQGISPGLACNTSHLNMCYLYKLIAAWEHTMLFDMRLSVFENLPIDNKKLWVLTCIRRACSDKLCEQNNTSIPENVLMIDYRKILVSCQFWFKTNKISFSSKDVSSHTIAQLPIGCHQNITRIFHN